MFVSNPSTLAHICQSIRYNLVSVLLLSCFVKVRYLSYGFKSTLCPKSNPIYTIFTNWAPFSLHFHSISISIWISTPLKGSNTTCLQKKTQRMSHRLWKIWAGPPSGSGLIAKKYQMFFIQDNRLFGFINPLRVRKLWITEILNYLNRYLSKKGRRYLTRKRPLPTARTAASKTTSSGGARPRATRWTRSSWKPSVSARGRSRQRWPVCGTWRWARTPLVDAERNGSPSRRVCSSSCGNDTRYLRFG